MKFNFIAVRWTCGTWTVGHVPVINWWLIQSVKSYKRALQNPSASQVSKLRHHELSVGRLPRILGGKNQLLFNFWLLDEPNCWMMFQQVEFNFKFRILHTGGTFLADSEIGRWVLRLRSRPFDQGPRPARLSSTRSAIPAAEGSIRSGIQIGGIYGIWGIQQVDGIRRIQTLGRRAGGMDWYWLKEYIEHGWKIRTGINEWNDDP